MKLLLGKMDTNGMERHEKSRMRRGKKRGMWPEDIIQYYTMIIIGYIPD